MHTSTRIQNPESYFLKTTTSHSGRNPDSSVNYRGLAIRRGYKGEKEALSTYWVSHNPSLALQAAAVPPFCWKHTWLARPPVLPYLLLSKHVDH